MNDPICGYKGDPVCEPPNCSGACPPNLADRRPARNEFPSQKESTEKKDSYAIIINLEKASREELDKLAHVLDKVIDLLTCEATVRVMDFE